MITLLNDTVQKIHAEHHPELFKHPTDASEVEGFFQHQIAADGNSIFIARAAGHTVGYEHFLMGAKMDFQSAGTFTLMVLLLTVIPGPNTALIIRTVPQNGRRAGIFNLAGIVSGFYIHGIFSTLGLSALILKTAQAFFVLKLLGSFYLLYLGVTSLWQAFCLKHASAKNTKRGDYKIVSRKKKGLFLEGFLTNLLNPKASMFYLAIFPQFISLGGNPILESLILVVIHSIVVVIWFSSVIIALGKITRALSSMKFKRIVQGVTGSLMLWFGYRLLAYQQKN